MGLLDTFEELKRSTAAPPTTDTLSPLLRDIMAEGQGVQTLAPPEPELPQNVPQPEMVATREPVADPQQPKDWLKYGFRPLTEDLRRPAAPAPEPATPEGAMTPLYYPDRAIAGEYGPDVKAAYEAAESIVKAGRTDRSTLKHYAQSTPENQRGLLLLAVSQTQYEQPGFKGKGTFGRIGTALKRGAQQFESAVHVIGQEMEELVGKAIGADPSRTRVAKSSAPTYGMSDRDRVFFKALQRARETTDPLVDPNDPFYYRWPIQAAEMVPAMAAGVGVSAVTGGGALPAIATWFAPIYDDARDELLEAGVDPTAARAGGAISAIVQAAVESLNLNPFKPKGAPDPVARGIRDTVRRYIKGYGKELSEEFIQAGVQAATVAAATQLDAAAPDQGLGEQLRSKMSDALAAAGPLAVMMAPGFVGNLSLSAGESIARRWIVNNPPERVEEVAAKERPSRNDLPEVGSAEARAALAEEVRKQKPRYRWNPKTGKMEPTQAPTPQPTAAQPAAIRPPAPGFGRPELANPGETQFARDQIDQIDQERKQAGVPERLPNEVVRARAEQRLAQNYEAEVQAVLRGDAPPGPDTTAIANLAYNAEAVKAMRGDPSAILRAYELGKAYRERRTDVARELQIGVDQVLTPEGRLGYVATSMTELPVRAQKQIEKLQQPARDIRGKLAKADGDIQAAWARLTAAFGGNLGANLGNLPEATKAAGDLVLAYARKGVYLVEDIIAELEASRGERLGSQVRQLLRERAEALKNEVRAERRRTETMRSEAHQRRIARNQEKVEKLVREWSQTMTTYKAELKRLKGIDLDAAEGLSPSEAASALFYLQSFHSDALDKWLEYRRFALLSAPDTNDLNLGTNTAHAGLMFFGRYPLDFVARKLRFPSDVNPEEFFAVYRNLFSIMNLRDALRTARKAFKLEVDVWELEEAQRGGTSPVDVGGRGAAIRGRKGTLLRIPQRVLLAADQMFKVLSGRAYVAMEAHRIASEEGFNYATEREAYDRRVQELMADRTSAAWESAIHLVRELVFQERTKTLDKINEIRGTGYGRLWQFVFTFTTTPWNVMRRALKMSPGIGTAALALDVASGNRKRISKGLADQIIGLTGWALLAAYNDPDDEEALVRFTGTENGMRRRKALIDTSLHQPLSLYIGKRRIGFNRFDPFATYLGIAVDAIEEVKRADTVDDAVKVVETYFRSMTRALEDKTWLQGVTDIFEAIDRARDGEGWGSLIYWARNFTVSHVPNVLRSASRDADPYMRDTRLYGEGADYYRRLLDTARIAAGFDVAEDQWAYDLWGQPRSMVEIEDAPVSDFVMRYLSPFTQNQQRPFIGTAILMRWNIDHPDEAYWPMEARADYSIGNGKRKPMTPEQRAQFLRLSGRLARARVMEFATVPPEKGGFNPLDKLTEVDRDTIKRILERSRTVMRKRLSAEWKAGATVTDEAIMEEYGIPLGPE